MKNYEYPPVRPPTALPVPQQPSDTRFSWMETPADEEHRVWANNTRRETGTPASAAQPPGQQPLPEQHSYREGAYPYPVQDFDVAQQQQQLHHHHSQELRYLHHGGRISQYTPAQVAALPPPTQPPQEPLPPIPQSPDPTKVPSSPKNEVASSGITPDVNPLTPTTPKMAQPRPSTNIAIVPPPTDPAQFAVSTYTPSPQSIRGGSWQHSLCSCAEPAICLTGLFCPCIIYGRTQYRLTLRGERKDPTNMLGYTAVNGSCIAFAILCGFNGILAAIQHTRVRKTFNMTSEAGNVAGDCLKGLCCCCCTVAQDEKEVKFREEQGRKPHGSAAQNGGYLSPGGMTFGPPPR